MTTDPRHPDREAPALVFIAALHREAAHVKRLIGTSETLKSGNGPVGRPERQRDTRRLFSLADAPGRLSQPQRTRLICSGIGRERAEAAVRKILHTTRPSAVIAIGFAGGTARNVRGGDLVVPKRVRGLIGSNAADAGVIRSDPQLFAWAVEALEQTSLTGHTGDLVSLPTPALTPPEKQRLAALHHAHAVDMESYWIGARVVEAGLPFLAARAISDELGDRLPEYERFLNENGTVRSLAAAAYYLARPRDLLRASRLAVRARTGTRRLAAFAEAFMKVSGGQHDSTRPSWPVAERPARRVRSTSL